jgi:hypothetical protein
VLVFFPAGDGAPLHAPERAPEAAPTIADDTWAAAGLLFWMLTGAPPAKRRPSLPIKKGSRLFILRRKMFLFLAKTR